MTTALFGVVFPFLPMLGAVAAALGVSGLYWYHSLSKEEQQEADRQAMGYARSLYNKKLDELTFSEFNRVRELTRKHH